MDRIDVKHGPITEGANGGRVQHNLNHWKTTRRLWFIHRQVLPGCLL